MIKQNIFNVLTLLIALIAILACGVDGGSSVDNGIVDEGDNTGSDGDGTSGSEEESFIPIQTEENLRSIGTDSEYPLDASYKLMNDITLSSVFEPIGERSNKFEGIFDGDGYRIRNLEIRKADDDYVALFKYVGSAPATVKNVTIEVLYIEGRNYVAVIAGDNRGLIDGVHVIGGTVSGASNIGAIAGFNTDEGTHIIDSSASSISVEASGNYVGGLVGHHSSDAIISNSSFDGSVSGNTMVGGLSGYLTYDAIIQNSFVTGSVTGSLIVGGAVGFSSFGGTLRETYVSASVQGSGSNVQNVGGLIGSNSEAHVIACYASGAVIGGSGVNVGGLVGNNSNNGTVRDSYASGEVSGTNNIGGLIGIGASGSVTRSYATGAVMGTTDVGGFIGKNDTISIISGYFDTGSTGISNGVGFGSDEEVSGIVSTDINDERVFPDWDFETTWQFQAAEWPSLQWEDSP